MITRNLGETDAHLDARRCQAAHRLMAARNPLAAASALSGDPVQPSPRPDFIGPCRVIRWTDPPPS